MMRTAMEGVRDAVITQLVIIGIQKLMNVLTLGGSAFADAAKGFSGPLQPCISLGLESCFSKTTGERL